MSRHPALLTRSQTGLLIIDLQEKFAPVIPGFGEIVSNTAKLILAFQMFDMPIIVTEQYPQGLGGTVDIIRKQFELLEIVEKLDFAATRVPAFAQQIGKYNLNTVVVCGVESHVCVSQTVHDLINDELNVHVVVDAVGSRYRLDYDWALRKMERSGAILSTTEMCLFELAEKAGTESFRNISRMVKTRKKLGVAVPESAVETRSMKPPQTTDQKPTTPLSDQGEKKPAPDKPFPAQNDGVTASNGGATIEDESVVVPEINEAEMDALLPSDLPDDESKSKE